MNVETFSACCADCGGTFSYPALGDFDYGCFILTGERGSVFAHLSAIEHPVFALVAELVGEAFPALHGRIAAGVIQSTCAQLADPTESQRLDIHRVCPVCRSRNWKWWHRECTGSIDVPDATYLVFQSLSDSDKRATILELATAVRASSVG